MEHYNQTPKRKAEFIKPMNTLKAKVGEGGLSEQILNKAQELLENNTVDFGPLADMYLDAVMKGVEMAKNKSAEYDNEYIISNMLYPTMQLKANGGMFHYPLVTQISDKLIQFLEVIEHPDVDVIEIVLAFHATIKVIVAGKIKGNGGVHGSELIKELDDACLRYFKKNPDNRDPEHIN